ncbi:hypothetical protein LP418_06290 [Nocardioides sp. B-3]|nr:hypothetical protein [Nocardioides sp. B-3]UUZ60487.1 hypothetical protein LP418_06290 [Nocardioides sp. B-3]
MLEQVEPLPADLRSGATAIDEGQAELALELGDRLAERRLGDVQGLAGPAQRPVLGDGCDVLELFDAHLRSFVPRVRRTPCRENLSAVVTGWRLRLAKVY